MRREFNTDLAVLPANAIDDNWFTYLREDPHAPREWLSRVLLERLLFRAGTIVRVRVSAADVYRRLGAAYDTARSGGAAVCSRSPSAAPARAAWAARRRRERPPGRPCPAVTRRRRPEPPRAAGGEEDLVDAEQVFARGEGTAPTAALPNWLRSQPSGGRPRPADSPSPIRRPASAADVAQLDHARASEPVHFYVKPAEFSFGGTQIHEPPGVKGCSTNCRCRSSGAKPAARCYAGHRRHVRYADWAVPRSASGPAAACPQKVGDDPRWLAALRVGRMGSATTAVTFPESPGDQVTNVTPTFKSMPGPRLVTRRRDYAT
jgi:hypothetical protein